MIATGLGLLRLEPSAFWRMTPREFERAASVLARHEPPPDRAGLAALMQLYPDR